jgi:hypothetical protein
MASLLKNIFRQKYSTAHVLAVFPVLGGLCPSSSKNDKEAVQNNNKTPPKDRFSERNAYGRFGHSKNKDFAARNEGKNKWAAKRKLNFSTDTENNPAKRQTRSSAVCKCLF